MVVTELDGSLDDLAYVVNLPTRDRDRNQNVFPFSLSAAALEVNLMLRYLLAEDWWPLVKQQDQQFVTGTSEVINEECRPTCWFRARRAQGDAQNPPYLVAPPSVAQPKSRTRFLDSVRRRWLKFVDRVSSIAR